MCQWEYLVRLVDTRRLYLEIQNRVTLRTQTFLADTIERGHISPGLDKRWTLSGLPVRGSAPIAPASATNKYLTGLVPYLRMRAVHDGRYVWHATGWVRNIDGSYTLQSIDVHSVGVGGQPTQPVKGPEQSR